MEPVAALGGVIHAVAADGDRLWIVQGERLEAVDWQAPKGPQLVGSPLRFPEAILELSVDGSMGLARSETALFVLDLADSTRPRLRSRIDLDDNYRWGKSIFFAKTVGSADWQAYVEYFWDDGPSSRLAAFDAKGRHWQVDFLRDEPFLSDMVAAGDLIAVSFFEHRLENQEPNLQLLHRRDGGTVLGTSWFDPAAGPLAFGYLGGRPLLYAGNSFNGHVAAWALDRPDRAIEILRWEGLWPSRNELLTGLAATGSGDVFASLERLSMDGESDSMLQRLSADAPDRNPIGVWISSQPPTADLAVMGGGPLVADLTGLMRMDRNGDKRESLPTAISVRSVARGTYAGQSAVYVASSSGITVYPADDPTGAHPLTHFAGEWGDEISAGDDLIIVGSADERDLENQRLQIFEVGRNGEIEYRSEIELATGPPFKPGAGRRFMQAGKLLIAQIPSEDGPRTPPEAPSDSLGLFDLTDPARPQLRERITVPGSIVDFDLQMGRIAVSHDLRDASAAAGHRLVGLSIFDLEGEAQSLRARPLALLELGPEADTGSQLPLVALDGPRAWLVHMTDCDRRLEFYGLDLSEPEHPQRTAGPQGSVWLQRFSPWAHWPSDIRIQDGYAFLPSVEFQYLDLGNRVERQPLGAWVIDLRRVDSPRLVVQMSEGFGERSVALGPRVIDVSDGDLGVHRFKPELDWASDPTAPSPTPLPSATPGPSPTAIPTIACRPTPTRTAIASPTPTASATPLPTASATATADDMQRADPTTLHLPYLGRD